MHAGGLPSHEELLGWLKPDAIGLLNQPTRHLFFTLTAEMLGVAMSKGEDLGALQLLCHPSTSVLVSGYAIVSLWAAHQGEGDLSTVDPAAPESALVVRPGLDVLVLRLPPGAARFVIALQAGEGLADAAALAAGEAADFDLPDVLALLMRHGVLTSVQLPRSPR